MSEVEQLEFDTIKIPQGKQNFPKATLKQLTLTQILHCQPILSWKRCKQEKSSRPGQQKEPPFSAHCLSHNVSQLSIFTPGNAKESSQTRENDFAKLPSLFG